MSRDESHRAPRVNKKKTDYLKEAFKRKEIYATPKPNQVLNGTTTGVFV